MGVGIALDQAAAADDLDRKIIIRSQITQCRGQPAVQMRRLDLVAQCPAAVTAQGPQAVQHQKGGQRIGAQPAALVEPAVQPGHPFWIGLDPCPKAGGQHAGNFFGAGMHEFGQLDQIGVGGPHFGRDPAKARAACLQVGHADHIIIGHGIGNVFGGLAGQRMVLVGAVLRQKGGQPVKIFRAIGQILKLHHLAQTLLCHVLHRGGQGGDAGGQGAPFRHQRRRAAWLRRDRWSRRGTRPGRRHGPRLRRSIGCVKGTKRACNPLARGADRLFKGCAGKGQHLGPGKGTEQAGRDHRTCADGNVVEIGGNQPACSNFGCSQRLVRTGDAVAGDRFFGHRQNAMGRGDQHRAVRRYEAAQNGAARLHHFGSNQDIHIPRRRQQREDRHAARVTAHLDVIDRGPGALCHTGDRGGLTGESAGAGHIFDPRGQHAAALPAHGHHRQLEDAAQRRVRHARRQGGMRGHAIPPKSRRRA